MSPCLASVHLLLLLLQLFSCSFTVVDSSSCSTIVIKDVRYRTDVAGRYRLRSSTCYGKPSYWLRKTGNDMYIYYVDTIDFEGWLVGEKVCTTRELGMKAESSLDSPEDVLLWEEYDWTNDDWRFTGVDVECDDRVGVGSSDEDSDSDESSEDDNGGLSYTIKVSMGSAGGLVVAIIICIFVRCCCCGGD